MGLFEHFMLGFLTVDYYQYFEVQIINGILGLSLYLLRNSIAIFIYLFFGISSL